MAAFLCNDYHINVLANYAASCYLPQTAPKSVKEIGELLHTENVKSLRYRYRGGEVKRLLKKEAHTFVPFSMKIDPVQIIKAAQCFAYQGCEHPKYEKSLAKTIINIKKIGI